MWAARPNKISGGKAYEGDVGPGFCAPCLFAAAGLCPSGQRQLGRQPAGGAARRGTLSDQFSDLALGCADYIMVVEEGNDDGKFSDAATDAGIPITMLYTIADAVTPLQEIFGA